MILGNGAFADDAAIFLCWARIFCSRPLDLIDIDSAFGKQERQFGKFFRRNLAIPHEMNLFRSLQPLGGLQAGLGRYGRWEQHY